jgi:hypothetical protein
MEKNSAYVAKMETQLKKWDADMDALAAAGEKASDAARTTYVESMKGLRANRDAARKSFETMRAASEEAGEKMQAAMTASWESMQKSLEKASADLRK